MPTNNQFDDFATFNKVRKFSSCPYATNSIVPDHSRIRHESFADRNFGMPSGAGITAGSISELEDGGDTALEEGASHIAFATNWRGSKEEMRNPYNTFSRVPNLVKSTAQHRTPDTPMHFGAPGGTLSGKERFVGSHAMPPMQSRIGGASFNII